MNKEESLEKLNSVNWNKIIKDFNVYAKRTDLPIRMIKKEDDKKVNEKVVIENE